MRTNINSIFKQLSIILPPLITLVSVFFNITPNLKNRNFNITITNPKNNYNTLRYFDKSANRNWSNFIVIFGIFDIDILIRYILHETVITIVLPVYVITILLIPFISQFLLKYHMFTYFYVEDTKYYIIGNRDQDNFYICQTLKELISSTPSKKYVKIEKNKIIHFETEAIKMSNYEFDFIPFTIIRNIYYRLKRKNKS